MWSGIECITHRAHGIADRIGALSVEQQAHQRGRHDDTVGVLGQLHGLLRSRYTEADEHWRIGDG